MSGKEDGSPVGFLRGGGRMGALMRERDWAATPLGIPVDWPHALRTLVSVMLGSSQPMLVVWGTERTVLYNDGYAELCGARQLGKLGGPFEALWPDIWDEVEPIMSRAYAGEPVHMDDLALTVTRNGEPEVAHFAFGYTPVRDEDGIVAGLFCACTETTAQSRAAAALRLSEARLRLVVEGAKDHAILTIDPEGLVTTWSAGAEAAFGYRAEEVLGRSFRIIFTPEDLATGIDRAELERCERDGVATFERWHRHKDGRHVFMNGSMRPLPLDGLGRPQGFLKIARDETLRCQDAEALRIARGRSHEILAGMNEGFLILDRSYRVLEINDEGLRIDGRRREELIGRRHCDIYPETVGQPVEEAYGRTMRERVPTQIVHHRVDPASGEERWLELRVFPIANGCVAGFYRDVTERKMAERRLVLSEESLRLATEAAEIGSWDTDIATGTLVWTRRTRAMFGVLDDRPCMLADFYAGLHPDDRAATRDAFEKALDPAVRATYDVTYRTVGLDDGVLRWVAAKGKALFDESGTCVRALGTAIDITAERIAQRRQDFLLDLSDRLRAEDSPRRTMQAAVDAIGRELAVNRVGFGLVDEAGGHAILETEYVDGVEPTAGVYPISAFGAGNLANLRAGRISAYSDVEKDAGTAGIGLPSVGTSALLAVPLIRERRLRAVLYINHATPREWRQAEIDLVEAVATRVWDAVERARAQDALRAVNETLEQQVAQRTRERDQIWKATSDLFCVASFEGYLISLNPSWVVVLGWSEAELKTVPFLEFVHPDDRAATLRAASALTRGEAQLTFENRYRHRDGSYRWFSWNAVPRDGVIYATVRDMTAIKAQAEALAKTEEALRQSQKMEAVGQLTGGLAHDFNNLLTGVSGSLELLDLRVRQGRFAETARYIEAAQGAARRAAALTHRLLAFSRRQTLDPKPTDVTRLISGLEELIRRTVGPAVGIGVINAPHLWSALVDPNQLENALLNLCINARDAMPEGGRITIETANRRFDGAAAAERELEPGQYLSIAVTDTGTGMAPDVIAKAFDPFFTTKPLGEGTGLGLSMIYGFARQSGGQVHIESTVGQGTTMRLYLPRHTGSLAEEQVGSDLSRAPRGEHGETVLVVDDEPTVRMLVTEVLGDLGYTAIEAADGASGLRVLQSDARIDLLVTDVGLPGGMNGRQMSDAARLTRPSLKVLFITGYAEAAVVGNGHLEPGMQVMTKPFVVSDLAARIREMIAA